jgi:hypothetical protein
MDLNPPEGSGISISYDEADPTIIIPAKGSASRYFGGVFLLFWLGGWAFGFKSAASQLMSGKGNLFIVVWLGGWTVGGILAALAAYRTFRPTVPETLQLERGSVAFDSGIPPLEFNTYQRLLEFASFKTDSRRAKSAAASNAAPARNRER